MSKKPPAPGAPTKTRTVPDAPPITALHWVGPRYLAALGTRDHSAVSMAAKGVAVYARAVASGWYVPTAAPVQDRGLPTLPAPTPVTDQEVS